MLSQCVYNTCEYFSYQETVMLTIKFFFLILHYFKVYWIATWSSFLFHCGTWYGRNRNKDKVTRINPIKEIQP